MPIRKVPRKKLVEWADANKMNRVLEVRAKNTAGEKGMQTALPMMPMDMTPEKEMLAMLTEAILVTAGEAQPHHWFKFANAKENCCTEGERVRSLWRWQLADSWRPSEKLTSSSSCG